MNKTDAPGVASKSSKLGFWCCEWVVYAKMCVVSKFGNISEFISNFGHKKYIIWGFRACSTFTAHDKHSFKCLVLRKHLKEPNYSAENFRQQGLDAQQTVKKYPVVLDLLLKLSSLWLLRRFQSTVIRAPWKPDFVCLGTCFKFWKCKNNLTNSVLSIIFYTLMGVVCSTLEGCAIRTACGVAKMRFRF